MIMYSVRVERLESGHKKKEGTTKGRCEAQGRKGQRRERQHEKRREGKISGHKHEKRERERGTVCVYVCVIHNPHTRTQGGIECGWGMGRGVLLAAVVS